MTSGDQARRSAWAPGRVNLMGDHTDHTGGLVLPMAIGLGTTVHGRSGGDTVTLRSDTEPEPAVVPLDVADPGSLQPAWARYVAGVVAELGPAVGFDGSVSTTLPVGAGLSSSAALEVATALALGFGGTALELARLCQRAEQRAVGVPCGIMDQLASAAGRKGAALRIDCTTFEVSPAPLPADLDVIIVHSGQERTLDRSSYAERAAQCRDAEAHVGPLRLATERDTAAIEDPTLRRRARHVVTENARVDAFAAALRDHDRSALRQLMAASHASLRDDFEVSTAVVDALVEQLSVIKGVVGARLTGAGFGGCVVALVESDTTIELPHRSWKVEAADGASVTSGGGGPPSSPRTPLRR